MRPVRRAAGQLLVSILLMTPLVSPAAALAQPADPSARPPSADGSARSSLTAPQPRVQVSLEPGMAAEGELRFTFDGSEPTVGQLSIVDFHVGPEGPRVQSPTEADATSSARWIALDVGSLTLRPATPAIVRYRAQVPTATPPGDYSALVLLSAEPSDGRVGVRLTVRVPGATRQQADLLAFRAQPEPLRFLAFEIPIGVPFYESGPVRFQTQVQNQGRAVFTPSGTIELLDWLGHQVASLDLPADQVYPGDTGTLLVQWVAPPALGVFTAQLNLQSESQPLTAQDRLVVLPWENVLAVPLFLIAIYLLLGRRIRLPRRGRGRREAMPEPTRSDQVLRAHLSRYGPERPEAGVPTEALNGSGLPLEEAAQDRGEPVGPVSNGVASRTDISELIRTGQQAARAGDRLGGYRRFCQAIELDPTNEEAWLWRAGTAERQGEAIRCLERVLQINPDNPRARRGLSELQARTTR